VGLPARTIPSAATQRARDLGICQTQEAIGKQIYIRLPSRSVGEHYGMVLLPKAARHDDAARSSTDIVAQRQRDGWQLVSTRVDSEGAEVMVFRRPA
jgi:hypothetical protein